jgi:hypothetical protein
MRAMERPGSMVEVALIDAAVDSYVDWREASGAARRAYGRWAGAERGDRPGAFAAYVAALDREERAGTRYAQAIAYVRTVRRPRRGRVRARWAPGRRDAR